jgi:molybdopterin-guanine dinucleotide biosynthesis adapter protein
MKVIQFIGYKNSGKTTLVCRLLQQLTAAGYIAGAVKHDSHQFEMDQPGKDTWRFREAGAQSVAITSAVQTAYIEQTRVSLSELVGRMGQSDYVLVEGFKEERYPKIVILKTPEQADLMAKSVNVQAVVLWKEMPELPTSLPRFHVNDTARLFDWLVKEDWGRLEEPSC